MLHTFCFICSTRASFFRWSTGASVPNSLPAHERRTEEAIRSEREHLIDLASCSPTMILADLRQAGAIVSLESDRIRVEGDRSLMTTELRALIRFHRAELINALRRELSEGAMVVGRVWTINDRILEFG